MAYFSDIFWVIVSSLNESPTTWHRGISQQNIGQWRERCAGGILRALHSLCVGQDIQEFPAVVERGA